jgi:hypothetical protein
VTRPRRGRLRHFPYNFGIFIHSTPTVLSYNSFVWSLITVVSSVSLVFLLGLAVFFPLQISISTEERREREQPRRQRARIKRHTRTDDDELYLDDDEL